MTQRRRHLSQVAAVTVTRLAALQTGIRMFGLESEAAEQEVPERTPRALVRSALIKPTTDRPSSAHPWLAHRLERVVIPWPCPDI